MALTGEVEMATPTKKPGFKADGAGILDSAARHVTTAEGNQSDASRIARANGRRPTPETVAAMLETRAMTQGRFATAAALFDALDGQTATDPNTMR